MLEYKKHYSTEINFFISVEDNKFSLHVRFCNDKGRRSWSRTVENYSGKQDLLMKFPSCLVSVQFKILSSKIIYFLIFYNYKCLYKVIYK